jgi:phage replication O-like protein O
MASPQKENGYTAIANELFDALVRTRVSGEDRQVLDFIIRKTYGFNKKEDRISLSQFQEATTMHRSNICRSIERLLGRNIIIKNATSKGNSYGFVKDFDKWGVVAKKLPSSKVDKRGSSKVDNKVVVKVIHTKDNTKDRDTKDTATDAARRVKETIHNPLGAQIIKAFSEFNPVCEKYYGNKTQRAACDHLIETHGLEKVLQIVAILPKTNTMRFMPTITTPYILADRWAQLEAAMRKKQAEQVDNSLKYKVAFH